MVGYLLAALTCLRIVEPFFVYFRDAIAAHSGEVEGIGNVPLLAEFPDTFPSARMAHMYQVCFKQLLPSICDTSGICCEIVLSMFMCANIKV